jgi:hypothetical protein
MRSVRWCNDGSKVGNGGLHCRQESQPMREREPQGLSERSAAPFDIDGQALSFDTNAQLTD